MHSIMVNQLGFEPHDVYNTELFYRSNIKTVKFIADCVDRYHLTENYRLMGEMEAMERKNQVLQNGVN